MTREIKFRAWDNHKKEMTHSFEFKNMCFKGIWDLFPLLENFDPEFVMQFTGLLDKNGKEIYEGDIVYHVEDVTQEIIGGYPRTEPEGIFTEVKIPDFYIKVGDKLPDADELEIIGNIYENPDLTK